MKITSPLFEAFLKCATKCHLRSLGETGSGNEYAEWVHGQDESYQHEAALRLQEGVPETERVVAPPATENFKIAQWRLAMDVVVQTPDRSADSHVREFQPSEETRGLGGPRSCPRRYAFGDGLSRLYLSRRRALLKGDCSGVFTKPAFTGFHSM